MPLTIGVIKETAEAETRVALVPDVVKKLLGLGAQVVIESGAGLTAAYTDDDYAAAGASVTGRGDVLRAAQVLASVQIPDPQDLAQLSHGVVVMGLATPHLRRDVLDAGAAQHLTVMGMELVPRISRAQAMDVLSSQSNLAGYRAVIEAAAYYTRAMPMMMTAAGTIAAAKVFVMGAGVAGLQAIATARRLGAVVAATDVRLAAKEQVASLGAKFIMVEDDETKAAETSGGYAREMSDGYKAKQAALIAETIKKQDMVITTALIPGRPAPRLVTRDMVHTMKAGSVIVDMAVEAGGNVEGSVAGEVVMQNGVTVVGYRNLAGRVATDASALYARNLFALYQLLVPKESGAVNINFDDDIIKGITLTHGGAIVHPQFKAGA